MATKKAAAKKSAAKKSAAKKKTFKPDPKTERIILKAVDALRENPESYAALRRSLGRARTDEARAKHLLRYATSERELAALLPGRGEQTALVTWTTVTVTTVTFVEAPITE